MTPTAGQYAALARSSPWRWSTVRFTVSWTGADVARREPVRAWVRRPGGLRVESLGGEVLQAGVESRNPAARQWLTQDGRWSPVGDDHRGRPGPDLDEEGLVQHRPSRAGDPDDPMYLDYRWVAMLDPVELGEPVADADEDDVACEVDALRVVRHAGRPAWEGVLRPTPAYDPRCSCCPLLHSVASDRWELQAQGRPDPNLDPTGYADAHLVVLDLATAICVATREIGGPRAGAGHNLVIEAVDELMADARFAPPPRTRRRRR